MEINIPTITKVDIKVLRVHVYVKDNGTYELLDATNKNIVLKENSYVPPFLPEYEHGDAFALNIDIETGQILNWKTPTVQQLEAFVSPNE